MKIQTVDDVHQWKKWWSMRWIIVTAILNTIPIAYMTLPEDWKDAVPVSVKFAFVCITLLTAGLAGAARVIKQPWPPLESKE